MTDIHGEKKFVFAFVNYACEANIDMRNDCELRIGNHDHNGA